jgi:hypothetical protein
VEAQFPGFLASDFKPVFKGKRGKPGIDRSEILTTDFTDGTDWEFLGILSAPNSAHEAFPFELGMFEIEEKSEPQTGDGEITCHLSGVRIGEGGNALGIHNDKIIDDEIRREPADELSVVVNGKYFFAERSGGRVWSIRSRGRSRRVFYPDRDEVR